MSQPTSQARDANGSNEHKHDDQPALVAALQQECQELRAALAEVQSERDIYLKAVYELTRNKYDFRDVTIADLEKISAGPVEALP